MTGKSVIPAPPPRQQSTPRPARSPASDPWTRNCFDFLRLAAALLVLTSHMFSIGGVAEPGAPPSFTLDGIGLAIFFSISGYLVAHSWLSDPHLLRFAARRLLRIVPALAMAILLSILVLGPLVGTLPPRSYFHDPATWAYLHDFVIRPDYSLPGVFGSHPIHAVNGSLWTIGSLLAMYGLVMLFGLIQMMKHPAMVLVIALSAAAASILYRRMSSGPVTLLSVDVQHVLDLGAYFWSGAAFYALRPHMTFTIPRVILVFSVTVMLASASELVTWTFFAIPYIVIASATRQDELFAIPRVVGDLSYGLYLYAFPVEQFVWDRYHDSMGMIGMILASMGITAVLAWLSWHAIEKHALKRKPVLRISTLNPSSTRQAAYRK